MPVVTVTVPGCGEDQASASIGRTELLFLFDHFHTDADAISSVHGFVDALIHSTVDTDTGLVAAPVASDPILTPLIHGGVSAAVILDITFHDGTAVERWLDESGLVDGDGATVHADHVHWTLTAAQYQFCVAGARQFAVDDALARCGDYVDIVDGNVPRLSAVREISVDTEASVSPAEVSTLGELLTNAPTISVTVTVEASFTTLATF